MGINSLKDCIKTEDSISNAKLLKPQDKNNVVIFVEGITDVKFFKKVFSKKVFIEETIGSKEKIKTILKEKHYNDDKVIGILDKDYDEYEELKNIFYYDYSCLETMLISSDETYENFIPIVYNGEDDIWELRENVLHKLKPLSLARKFNYLNSLSINFEGVKIPNIVCDNCHVIIESLIQELVKKNNCSNFTEKIKMQIENYINIHIKNEYSLENLLYITQGHDLISMFKIHCNLNQKKHTSDSELSKCLKTAYRMSDFKKTKLCKSLTKHFNTQNIQLFKNLGQA